MFWILFVYYDCTCFKIFIWIAKDIQFKVTDFLWMLEDFNFPSQNYLLPQVIAWNYVVFLFLFSCNLETRVLHYISVGIPIHKYSAHVTCIIDWKSNFIFWFVWQYDNGFEALWFLSFQFDILSARLKKMAWLTSRTASSFFVLYILKIFSEALLRRYVILLSLSNWQSMVSCQNFKIIQSSKEWTMEIK